MQDGVTVRTHWETCFLRGKDDVPSNVPRKFSLSTGTASLESLQVNFH